MNQIFKDLAVMIHDQGEMIGKCSKHRGVSGIVFQSLPVCVITRAGFFVCLCFYVRMFVFMCVVVYVCMFVCPRVCGYAGPCLCLCASLCVVVYVCMFLFVFMRACLCVLLLTFACLCVPKVCGYACPVCVCFRACL